ncbi:hypothetical protein B0H65DRAFT_73800 [Neurospora tetraspora]|uniref:Uncharacterized protein n=1 Tax=Neurospora tetraspora TaxID=94610 RepID=A0AAE0JR48_9PEZI|nr:hypothetical protein B0H65DRAFT_73800 [Neurospora tetraspora]
MIRDFLDRTGLIVQQQPSMLNQLPLTCLLPVVLIILGRTLWILHKHLKAIKSQDDPIPLPSDLYLLIGVLVKASLTSFPPSFWLLTSLSTNALTAISVPCVLFFPEIIYTHRLLQLQELQVQGQAQRMVHPRLQTKTWKNTTQPLPSSSSTPHGCPAAVHWYACLLQPLLWNFGISSSVRCK